MLICIPVHGSWPTHKLFAAAAAAAAAAAYYLGHKIVRQNAVPAQDLPSQRHDLFDGAGTFITACRQAPNGGELQLLDRTGARHFERYNLLLALECRYTYRFPDFWGRKLAFTP